VFVTRACQSSGRHAKPNTPTTWHPYTDALTAYRTGGFDGLGFCLGDGWAGADLDHCRDGLIILPVAQALVDLFDCYCEVSPSGTGLKLFFRARRIGFEVDFLKGVKFTPWQSSRFFAVTGHGTGDPTVDRDRVVDDVLPAPTQPVTARNGFKNAADFDDEGLTHQAMGGDGPNSDKFLALWLGDTSAYGHDHSRADLALCCMLAFWTNYDEARIDRIFQRSGLMRPKWNTTSYRRATLHKAMQSGFDTLENLEVDAEGEELEDTENLEVIDPDDDDLEVIDPNDDLENLEVIDPNDLLDEVKS
jgi:putative DNA primase/helicase